MVDVVGIILKVKRNSREEQEDFTGTWWGRWNMSLGSFVVNWTCSLLQVNHLRRFFFSLRNTDWSQEKLLQSNSMQETTVT